MRWAGLTPLQLLAALAGFGALVVALYLLKQRPRRVVVPAVALWEALLGQRDAAALWTRLRRIWSLLLALLVMGLVLFAIADLRRGSVQARRSVLILIDASASMAARDERPSRLERAREKARALLDTLGAADRALIVQVDSQATALSPLSEDGVALRRALADVHQTDLAGDLAPAAQLALDVLGKQERAELVLISDGNLSGSERADALLRGLPNLNVRYLSVGKSTRNFAITSFSVRRYPLDKTHHESIVTVTSFAPSDERVRLTIRAGTALLHDEVLLVPHGQSLTRTLADLAGADDALEARIEPVAGKDMLASDDRAFATLPPRARTRVLVVSSGNRYLEAALLLDEYLELDETTPERYSDAGNHDVVVFDRFVPRILSAPSLFLGPRDSGSGAVLKLEGEESRPFFDRIEREHPLVRLCALADVNSARAPNIQLEPDDHVIAATASKLPLIFAGMRTGQPFAALAIDVRESDLPLRPAWPLFVLGAIDHLHGDNQTSVERSEAGSVIRVSLPEGTREAELRTEDGTRELLHAAQGQLRIVRERAGLYTLSAQGVTARLAINVPAASEGDIAPRPHVLRDAEHTGTVRAQRHWFGERTWPALLLFALLLLAAEWLTFHRRWTL
jgi:Mg-chelatase subunit ChlD